MRFYTRILKGHLPTSVLLLTLPGLFIALLVARVIVAPSAHPAAAAWDLARQAGSYHFAANVVQRVHPVASVASVGHTGKEERFHIAGRTSLPAHTMEMQLWSQGGSVALPETATEIRVEGSTAWARQHGQAWHEVGNLSSTFAPGGDFLSYLVGATNVQSRGSDTTTLPTGSTIGYTRYTFQMDGPTFARFMRQQAEAEMTRQGKLPPGARLGIARLYRDMTGSGELWVRDDGLPLRQVLHLTFPEDDDEQVSAEIITTFSHFGNLPARAVLSTWTDQAAHTLHTLAGRAPALLPPLLALALGVGATAALIAGRRSRRLACLLALSISTVLVLEPLLMSLKQAELRAEQSAQAAEQQRSQEIVEQRNAVIASYAQPTTGPHANPLEQAQTKAQLQAEEEDYLIDDYAEENEGNPDDDDDNDGLSNAQEWLLGTSSSTDDDNGDGFADGRDSDLDGINDYDEVHGFEFGGQKWYTDPLEEDTNRDGIADGDECVLDSSDRLLECSDSDDDGTPDVYDSDNDGDGVPDRLDLSPATSLGKSGAENFSPDNAFKYRLTDLKTDKVAYVQFQLRPSNPDHLWYALNVLDWPHDRKGGIQDDDGKTFADVNDSGGDNRSNEYGDMKLLPMLELRINTASGNPSNLPLADAPGDTVTLRAVSYYTNPSNNQQVPLYGDEVGTVTLEQAGSNVEITPDSDLKDTTYSSIEIVKDACADHDATPTPLHTVDHQGGTLADQVFKQWQIDPADGQRIEDNRAVVTRDDNGNVTACGTISQRSFEGNAMIDHDMLAEYGISVRDADRSGEEKLVHVPLHVVTDNSTDARVAFQGKLFYQVRSSWGQSHQARLVWVVQALVDECKQGATSDTICTDYAYHNTTRVVHAYDDDWYLTGMQVREDHGADLAIFYEDLDHDEKPQDDYSLGVVAKGLEERFLEARSDAQSDLTIHEFGKRFDRDENDNTDPDETWQLRRQEEKNGPIDEKYNILQVQTYAGTQTTSYDDYQPYYAHLDELAADVATVRNGRDYGLSETILRAHFQGSNKFQDDLKPTLLFAQSQYYRANNLDNAHNDGSTSVTWDSDNTTLHVSFNEPPEDGNDAPEPLPNQEMRVVNWVPYQYDADEDAWSAMPLEDYWNELEDRYKSKLHASDFGIVEGNDDENNAGLLFLFQLDYAALFYGLTFEVKTPSAPANPTSDESIARKVVAGGAFLYECFTKYRLDNELSSMSKAFQKLVPNLGQVKKGMSLAIDKLTYLERSMKQLGTWAKANKLKAGVAAVGVVALIVLIVLLVELDIYGELTGDAKQKTSTAIVVGVFGGLYVVVQAVKVLRKAHQAGGILKTMNQTVFSNSYKAAIKAVIWFAVIIVVVVAFFFVKTVLENDISTGSLAFEYLLAYTIATIIALILITMVNLIPVVGQILSLVVLLVDTILMLFGLPTFTELVTKAIFWTIYGLDVMVETTNTTLHTWMELENPEQGMEEGNALSLGMEIRTEAKHLPPKSWQANVAYLWKWNENNLRSTSFIYRLEGEKHRIDAGLGTMAHLWQHVGVYREHSTKDMWRGEQQAEYAHTARLQAGINQTPAVWLNYGYAIPAQSCWTVIVPFPLFLVIPVCRDRPISGSNSVDIGSDIVVDVFPATLDEFYALKWDSAFPVPHDADGDGLRSNTYNGNDPNDATWDTDGDGLADIYELNARERGTAALSVISGDTDGDGLTDMQEMHAGSNPANRDSDHDGLSDAEEIFHQVYTYNTERETWEATDTWQGGWDVRIDRDEQLTVRATSDPNDPDSDDDGISDLAEKKLEEGGHHGYHPTVWNENPVGIVNHLDEDSEFVRPGEPLSFTSIVENSKSDIFVDGTLEIDRPAALGGGTEARTIDIGGNESTTEWPFTYRVEPGTPTGVLHIETEVIAQTRSDPTRRWKLEMQPGTIANLHKLQRQAISSGDPGNLESFVFAAETATHSEHTYPNTGDIYGIISDPNLRTFQLDRDGDWQQNEYIFTRDHHPPDVACNDGTSCAVVWSRHDQNNNSDAVFEMLWFDKATTPWPASLTEDIESPAASQYAYRPIVATNTSSGHFLVLWSYDDGSTRKTMARFIHRGGHLRTEDTGGPANEVLVDGNSISMYEPEMVWEGDSYRVVYSDDNKALHALRLNESGQYIEGSHEILDGWNLYEHPHPQLAYNPVDDTTLVVYQKDVRRNPETKSCEGWLQARLHIDGAWSESQWVANGAYPQVSYDPTNGVWLVGWSTCPDNGHFHAKMFETDHERRTITPSGGADARATGEVQYPDRADMACPSPDATPLFDFRFEDEPGATSFANHNRNNAATCIGEGMCPDAGISGRTLNTRAASFNGSTQALHVVGENVPHITRSRSVAVWFKPHSKSGMRYILGGADVNSAFLRINNGTYELGKGNYQDPSGNKVLLTHQVPDSDIDNWVHLAFTYDTSDNNAWHLYHNGSPVGEEKYNPEPVIAPGWTIGAQPRFGGTGYDGFFEGLIDTFSVYENALQADQIRSIYNDSVLSYCFLSYPDLGQADHLGVDQESDNVLRTARYQLIDETEQSGEARNDASVTVTVDDDPPVAELTSLHDGDAVNGRTSLVIGGTARDPTSSVRAVQVSTDGGSTWQEATGTEEWSYTLDMVALNLPEGENTISVQAEDTVGNIGPAQATTIVVDHTPPDISDNMGAGVARARYAQEDSTIDSRVLHISGTVIDPAPGGSGPSADVERVDVVLVGLDGAAGNGEQPATIGSYDTETGWEWWLNYALAGDNPTGTYEMQISATDRVGNHGVVTKTVQVDDTAPDADLRYTAPNTITRVITRSTTIGGVVTDTGHVASVPVALEWSLVPAERADLLEAVASDTVLDLPFEGEIPNAYEDTSGSANIVRCPTGTCPPISQYGLDSPGANDGYAPLKISSSPSLSFGSNDSFSVHGWAHVAYDGEMSMVRQQPDDENPFWYDMRLLSHTEEGQEALFAIGSGNNEEPLASVKSPLPQSGRAHLVGVISETETLSDSFTMQLYVDGKLATTQSYSRSTLFSEPISGTGNIDIALEHNPFFFQLDNVRVYKRGLSAEEVGALYRDNDRSWLPAQITPTGPVTATWSADIPEYPYENLEGFYQLDIRGRDAVGNRNTKSGDWNVWRGEIDLRPPQLSIDTEPATTEGQQGHVYRCYAQDLNLLEASYSCPSATTTAPVLEEQRRYYDSDWWRRYGNDEKRLIAIDQAARSWGQTNTAVIAACDIYNHCSVGSTLQKIIGLPNEHQIELLNEVQEKGNLPLAAMFTQVQTGDTFTPQDLDPALPAIPLDLGIFSEEGIQSVTWLVDSDPISTVTAADVPQLLTATDPFTLEQDFAPPLDPSNAAQWLTDGRVELSAEIVGASGTTYHVPPVTIGLDSLPPQLALLTSELAGFDPNNPTMQLEGNVFDATWIDQVEVSVGGSTWRPATLEGDHWIFDVLRPEDIDFADGEHVLPQPGQTDPLMSSLENTALAQSGQSGHTSVPRVAGGARPTAPDGETQPLAIRASDTAGHTTVVNRDITLDSAPPAPVIVQLAYRDSSGAETAIGADGLVPTAPATLVMTWGESSDGSGVQDYAAAWSEHPTLELDASGTAPDLTTYSPGQEMRHTAPAEEAQVFYAHLVIRDTHNNVTIQTFGPVYVDSPPTADILRDSDGLPLRDYDAWRDSGCSLLGTSYEEERSAPGNDTRDVAQQLFATWDEHGLRMDWDGANWDGEGDLFVYFDTREGGTQHALNPYPPTAIPTTTIDLPPRLPDPQDTRHTVHLPLVVSKSSTAARSTASHTAPPPVPTGTADALLPSMPIGPADGLISGTHAITAYTSTVGLPFAADYTLWLTDTEHVYLLRWDEETTTWSQERDFPTRSHAWYAPDAQRTSIFLPFEWLGITAPAETRLKLVALASEEEALRLWATMPDRNPLNSPRVTSRALSPAQRAAPFALTHAYQWASLGNGVCPASGNFRGSYLKLDITSTPDTFLFRYLGDSLFYQQNEVESGGKVELTRSGFLQNGYPPVAPGGSVEYTLTYANEGRYTAEGAGLVVVAWPPLSLPDGARKSAPGDGPYDELTIPLGDLAPGSRGSETVRVQVAPGATDDQHGLLDITLYDTVSLAQHQSVPLERAWSNVAIDLLPPEVDLIVPDLLPPTSDHTIVGRVLDPAGVRAFTLAYQVMTDTVQTVACSPAPAGNNQWHCPLHVANPVEGTQIRMQARATDRSGFTSEWTGWRTRVIDATPPWVNVNTVMDDGQIAFSGEVRDNRSARRVEICPQDSGAAGAAASTGVCQSMALPSSSAVQSWFYRFPVDHAVDGEEWPFFVYGFDGVGNASAPLSITTTVDTVPPVLVVSGHQQHIDLATYHPDAPDPTARQPVLSGTASDGGGLNFIEVLVHDQASGNYTMNLVDSFDADSGLWTYTLLPVHTGTYTLRIIAHDQAGNVSRSEQYTVEVE